MRLPILRPRVVVVALGTLAATVGLRPAVAEEAAVQVYECNQGGKVIFSGTPCTDPGGDPILNPLAKPGGPTQRRLEIDYTSPDAAQAQAADQAAAAQESQSGAVAQAALLETEIVSLEQRITNLTTERDQRIAALRDRLAQGTASTDAADNAAWTAGMNEKIASVYDSYSDTIVAAKARLGELQAQRASLGPSGPAQ